MTGLSRRGLLTGLTGAGAGLVLGGAAHPGQISPRDKISLWEGGPHLRGACLAQRRVYPDLDGPRFLGPGPVGTPVSDAALDALARSGANLAVLSHPGLFSETPPYRLDAALADHLDDLVTRCEARGLFTVIGFRTGPGRSEFTFHRDHAHRDHAQGDRAGGWFPAEMINERVWRDFSAWQGWEAMWRHTASHFAGRRGVAGYLLMVEPNANQVSPGPGGGDLEVWDPQSLNRAVAGGPGDWSALSTRLARAVREADPHTPILISPDGYAALDFESLIDLESVSDCVLCLHDYAPRVYTHQGPGDHRAHQAGMGALRAPQAQRWMMGEFGVTRFAPGAAEFLDERIAALETLGAGWSLFRWDSGWRVYEDQENRFNPLHADPAVMTRLRAAWAKNTLRASPVLRR